MNAPAHYVRESVVWHPDVPGRIMPDVAFDCIMAGGDPNGDVTLLLMGFGESEASGAYGVDELAKRGSWGVATTLPFGALSPEPADLERIAKEGPQFLAQYFGAGRKVKVVTNSLGTLGALGVVEAPDDFSSVRMMDPFPLVAEHIGRLPLVGSTALTRRIAVGVRLGILTPLQLARYAFDGDVKRVGSTAWHEVKGYGGDRNKRLDHGFHPETGRRAADSAVALMATHGLVAACADGDLLVRSHKVRKALHDAADRKGVDRSVVDERLITVRGPHAPLCSREGLKQFTALLDHQLPAVAEAL
ncbi:MAG TPA: hypothetical protein VL737_01710 [Candidatus Pristimantibacillus sp.]|nr:hypothetical protein [Candidatus Pristimantibacillus sp.]